MNSIINKQPGSNLYTVRGQKVMLDRDVAVALGVETKQLNENATRSPKWTFLRDQGIEAEYRFQLTVEEVENLRSQIATFNDFKYLPYVYTRKGCTYFGTSMNSPQACVQAVQLVEVFDAVVNVALKNQLATKSSQYLAIFETALNNLREHEAMLERQALEMVKLTHATEDTAQRVTTLEVSHNLSGNYYAVKGFASLKGVSISEPLAAQIGKATAKYCRESNLQIDKITHPLYGKINTYPENALEVVWARFFSEDY